MDWDNKESVSVSEFKQAYYLIMSALMAILSQGTSSYQLITAAAIVAGVSMSFSFAFADDGINRRFWDWVEKVID